jgi:predicted O-methyltransferase YrrM
MDWLEVRQRIEAIEGLLSEVEAKCLYQLARNCDEAIVEIGSWKGKSTVCLALASKAGKRQKVFAIDPHQGLRDNGAEIHQPEGTELIFRKNIKRARVDDIVVPLVMKSEEAAKGWKEPVSLLFIDGAHDYENVRLDFNLWEPHLTEGGIIAFHDALYSLGHSYPGIRKVVTNNILKSPKFSNVQLCGSMVYATKSRTSVKGRFLKLQKLLLYYTLPLVYLALAPVYRTLARTRLLSPVKRIRNRLQL